MNQLHLFFLFLSLFSLSLQAGVIKNIESDFLLEVSRKLNEIDVRLRDQKMYVEKATFHWKELDQFRADLLFAVAHDPIGSNTKDIPDQVHPTSLTQKLKGAWSAIELDVIEMGEIGKTNEWASLKSEVENFFSLRDKFYYQPARGVIKSGALLQKIQDFKHVAAVMTKESIRRDVGVKVMDPVTERLSLELGHLGKSVRKLVEMNTPAPIPPATIFDPKYIVQLGIFGALIFVSAFLLALSGIWMRKKLSSSSKKAPEDPSKSSFNYYDWLKKFESNLNGLRRNEEDLSEHFIELNVLGKTLTEAVKGLNEASGTDEYYAALESLNHIGPKLEGYLQRQGGKKHFESTRKIITQCIQICDAIEGKKDFHFEGQIQNLRLVKLERTIKSKSA
jgi:hypothetical protein